MATITTDSYLDSLTRTAGESFTINSGAKLTIRTDTRVSYGAPASMTGSLGTLTLNDGEVLIDARNVRWLAFDSGTGNVPAIGSTISQGGVSGYLLGVWESVISAPTAVGAAMPISGFLKFREVTGGSFAIGALTGIGASATKSDGVGWIEIVHNQLADIAVLRFATYRTRGDWFYLDDTDGSVGQLLRVPINGGGVDSYSPGVWIETEPGSDLYNLYPGLNGAANGWAYQHLGAAEGFTDRRQQFVKHAGSGQMQIGEAYSRECTYNSLAAQDCTYSAVSMSMSYTWADDIIQITLESGNGHQLWKGMQTGLVFNTGDAVGNDGIYTVVDVIDVFNFTVVLAGSGTGGTVVVRPGILITFTAHTLNMGNKIYCNFTSGTGVSGIYEVCFANGLNLYTIAYPHTTPITAGNVSCIHTLIITDTAHGKAVGNDVYLDFTSGDGVDGRYFMRAVAANTFNINFPHSAVTSGSVTAKYTIGYIPPAGCKTRIPNIITQQCVTTTRSVNAPPHGTMASRPEFTTLNAGNIDLEFFYNTGWSTNFTQSYTLRMIHTTTCDALYIAEIANYVVVEDVLVGMFSSLDYNALSFSYCFSGGLIKDSKFCRGNTPSSSDHGVLINYDKDLEIDNCECGIIQFARSSGYPLYINGVTDVVIKNQTRVINGRLNINSSDGVIITDFDSVERFIGNTNAATGYCIVLEGRSKNVLIDSLTWGYNFTIPNTHPLLGAVYCIASEDIKIRNIGSIQNPIDMGTWEWNTFGCPNIFISGGANNNIELKRCYCSRNKTGTITTPNNTDNNRVIENCGIETNLSHGSGAVGEVFDSCDSKNRGIMCVPTISVRASVYGLHFVDSFLGSQFGRYILHFHQPSVKTAKYYTELSGTPRFNSTMAVRMDAVGTSAIWEDAWFRRGHTAFRNAVPVLTGGTIGNYNFEYQIDIGNGWNGTWKTLNTTNLVTETISGTIGFKLKIKITTTVANTSSISSLRINTLTTPQAQLDSYYPLDSKSVSFTISGLQTNSEVRVYKVSDGTEIASVENSNSTFQFNYDWEGEDFTANIVIHNMNYEYLRFDNVLLTDDDIIMPVSQKIDRVYANI